jgi:3-hydroxyisobutyrate dehydrogenase
MSGARAGALAAGLARAGARGRAALGAQRGPHSAPANDPAVPRAWSSASTNASSPTGGAPAGSEAEAVAHAKAVASGAVGVVGLGAIGSRLARRLVRVGGRPVHVFDKDPAAAARVVAELGGAATLAASPAALAAACASVVTSLPDADAAADVWLHPGHGLLAANGASARRTLTLGVDVSTTGPAPARTIAAATAAVGVAFVSAPLSGGVAGADAGSLTFLVGATSPAATAAAAPLLHAMGRRVIVVDAGDAGAGQVAKLANQLALAAQMAGVCEALAYGAAAGIAPDRIAAVLAASTGASWSAEVACPAPGVVADAPSSHGYAGGFAVRLMVKDLELAAASWGGGESEGGGGLPPSSRLPLAAAAAALFRRAAAAGAGDLDFSVLYREVYKEGK